ncbi:hypothetical protein ACEPAH_686 [Sanghuangporus vaninii]
MADYETRPLSVYRSSDWYSMNGRSSEPGPSSSRASHTSIVSSSLNSRRRSSAASAPPAGPPPTLPIPSLPALSESTFDFDEDGYGTAGDSDYISDSYAHSDPPVFDLNPFQRPAPSSQLTAVTQFPQARLAAATSVPPHSRLPNNLSDSPPRSILPRLASSQPPPPPPTHPPPDAPSREIVPDRLLLSPPEARENPAPSRPSSRRALTRALELAREAVRLDSTNDDPHGAIRAYGESVALLNEVMERVMRGEDTERRRNGRRRSIVAQEEELRRLRSIHDTYADRMNILSLIYSIPTDGQPPELTVHSRPGSPSSEASRDSQPTVVNDAGDTDRGHTVETRSRASSNQSVSSNGSQPLSLSGPSTSSHNGTLETVNGAHFAESNRISAIHLSKQTQNLARLRSSSNLPPRPPAPSNSPPSTPAAGESRADVSVNPPSPHLVPPASNGTRSRGSSVSHRRVGSGSRLEALKEEAGVPSQRAQYDYDTELRRTQMNGKYGDSPPLPALPSSSGSEQASSETPRGPATSGTDSYAYARPRNGSTFSDSTGSRASRRLINETPGMGTISQRREKNKSNASAITEALVDGSDGSLPNRLSMNTTSSISGGRSRASSHPVRPTMPVSGLPPESGTRPPFQPSSQSSNGTSIPQPRKSSLRQSPQPRRPQQPPSFPPSSFPNHGLTLVPPPPILPGQLPTTPTSPLPPMPPSDALRRPYHLMNLLGHTMTSKSGGYITRRLHVPYEVWSQGGAKLTNLPEKIRVVEVLCDALTDLQNASVEFAGPMSVASGMGMGVGSITRKDGEIWAMKLEEFSVVCDNVVSNFGKKLGVGEGFVVKKNSGVGSWGGKLSRQLDKLTNGKNLDSPLLYVMGLQKLFTLSQLLDEHTMAVDSQPMAPVYAALPVDVRVVLEARLRRSSEFFATVVLTFVIRDLSQLLDKYAKKGEKWLAE